MISNSKNDNRKKRHRSIRKRIAGSAERPRLAVFRSARHIYAQIIDDLAQKTLLSVSDKEATTEKAKKKDLAKLVGAAVAKKCLEKGIDKVVFDRAGYKYHGRVSALADGAREAGLKF
ncbi:MAG TPA: 50S ribosomal protein L18 [Polyangia bacterium]|jgi:large subunit ribosomal protein L18|nr:50S ribosomal protein L18 [Polyangia bacterium]